jgi:hypothetical protein
MRSSDRGARESGQVVHDTTRLWCSDSDTYITGAEPFRGGLIKPKARLLSTDSEEYNQLMRVLPPVYPKFDVRIQLRISSAYQISIGDTQLGCADKQSYRPSYVLTSYDGKIAPAQVYEFVSFAVDVSLKPDRLSTSGLQRRRVRRDSSSSSSTDDSATPRDKRLRHGVEAKEGSDGDSKRGGVRSSSATVLSLASSPTVTP